MSNTSSSINIEQSFRNLRRSWKTTSESWQDSEQRKFDRDYWQPLESTISNFINNLTDLESTLQQARREIK